ncbi:MAG: MBL fold metallo-hydrolase [Bacillota bacterium]|nr:MBL fold metallo-hydrolase [Bacillota bacterium]
MKRLVLPTPYAVGPVNAYLLMGAEPTLVDAGPATRAGVEALLSGLAAAGVKPIDVRRVIVTHAHPDHYGGLALLQGDVGWEVAAHPRALLWMSGDPVLLEARVAFYLRFLQHAGVPAEVLRSLEREGLGLRQYPRGITVHRFLREGDRVEAGDDRLVVHHTPGHASSALSLVRPGDGLLFSGDTLLGHISSNALVEPVDSWSGERRPSLPEYLRTLVRLRALPVRLVLPGHGDPVSDHRALVCERLGLYRVRRDRILDLLGAGPATVYGLCLSLFPDLERDQLFLGLSETVGYLDLLEEEGMVGHTMEGGVMMYRPSGAAA